MSRQNNYQKYLSLRKKHPKFYFHDFHYHFAENEFFVEFHFSMGYDYHFKPVHSIKLPSQLEWQNMSDQELEQLVFHLGMVEVISYWKAACSPQLIIKPFTLNKEQIDWWKKLYFEGLGEFFYLNSIDTNRSGFMDIICESDNEIIRFDEDVNNDLIMVPIGGGKDSIVTLEIIKNAK